MEQRVLMGEFLDEIAERAESKYNGLLHQGFLDWYIEAEFGTVRWDFTDGPNDGAEAGLAEDPSGAPRTGSADREHQVRRPRFGFAQGYKGNAGACT